MIPMHPHVLWNAIDVMAPPSGFTAAVGNGSSNDAPALQAIFNALPINGSRAVFFPRPPSSYRIASTVQIGTSDTTIVFEDNKFNQTSVRVTNAGRPTSAPMFRIRNFTAGQPIERVYWSGGALHTNGLGLHDTVGIQVDFGRFVVIDRTQFWAFATAVEIGASGSGQVSEFCGLDYCQLHQSAGSGTVEELTRFGSYRFQAHSGLHRNCFQWQTGIFGQSAHEIGSSWNNGEDGLYLGGDGDSLAIGTKVRSAMIRKTQIGAWYEFTTTGLSADVGSTGTRVGYSSAPSGWVAVGNGGG